MKINLIKKEIINIDPDLPHNINGVKWKTMGIYGKSKSIVFNDDDGKITMLYNSIFDTNNDKNKA